MRPLRVLLTTMLAVGLLSALAACGKKGPPQAPGDEKVTPRAYPAQ